MVFLQNLWVMKTVNEKNYFLEMAGNPGRCDRIEATNLRYKIGNWEEYNYYVFDYDTVPRYVFVTRKYLNFSSFLFNMGTRCYSFLVEGALFNLKEGKFMEIHKPLYSLKERPFFYKFLIYDTGIPNIVYSEEKNTYAMLYIYGKHIFEEVTDILTTVTCVTESGTKRAIFYSSQEGKREVKSVLILEDSIAYFNWDRNVKFVKFIDENPQSFVDESQSKFCVNGSSDGINLVLKPAYFSCGVPCIIAKTPRGEFGELIPILLNDPMLFDYSYGCFDFEVVKPVGNKKLEGHFVLKCHWARNDFENAVSYFDITDRKVYDEI